MSQEERTELEADPVRLTDNIGIIGVENYDYGDQEEYGTTVSVSVLKDAVDILDTLGYKQIDVNLVESAKAPDENPVLAMRVPGGVLSGDPVAVTVAPRTQKGRESGVTFDGQ